MHAPSREKKSEPRQSTNPHAGHGTVSSKGGGWGARRPPTRAHTLLYQPAGQGRHGKKPPPEPKKPRGQMVFVCNTTLFSSCRTDTTSMRPSRFTSAVHNPVKSSPSARVTAVQALGAPETLFRNHSSRFELLDAATTSSLQHPVAQSHEKHTQHERGEKHKNKHTGYTQAHPHSNGCTKEPGVRSYCGRLQAGRKAPAAVRWGGGGVGMRRRTAGHKGRRTDLPSPSTSAIARESTPTLEVTVTGDHVPVLLRKTVIPADVPAATTSIRPSPSTSAT
jgi:hypothetical protein